MIFPTPPSDITTLAPTTPYEDGDNNTTEDQQGVTETNEQFGETNETEEYETYPETYDEEPVSGSSGSVSTTSKAVKATTKKSGTKNLNTWNQGYFGPRQSRYFNYFSFNRRFRWQRWWMG